jgi:chromosome segregation protein
VVQTLEQQAKELEKEFAHQQAAAQTAVGRLDEIEQTAHKLTAALSTAQTKRDSLTPHIAAGQMRVAQLQAQLAQIESDLSDHAQAIEQRQAQLAAGSEQQTVALVELARAEQRLEAALTTLQHSTRNQQERQQAVAEASSELSRLSTRRAAAELEILRLTAQLAEDYLISEREEERLEGLALHASQLRQARSSAAKQLDAASRRLDKLDGQRLTAQSELERFRESAESLLKRFQEDYAIDYEQLCQAEPIADAQEQANLDAEAASLRVDVASVGEINMAALAELDELQTRYDFLNGQYEDLQAAKESLQRIIHKINADSRRMPLEVGRSRDRRRSLNECVANGSHQPLIIHFGMHHGVLCERADITGWRLDCSPPILNPSVASQ